MTFPYAIVGGDFMILDPQRTLLKGISQFSMKERVVIVRELTHWMFVPYLKAGHTNSGEAMTMGRMTCVVLSTALLTKIQVGKQGVGRYEHTCHFQSRRL